MDISLTRYLIFSLALSALAFALGIWITYLVLKASIRDGIKESGLIEALKWRDRPRGNNSLPDMRAD